MKQYNKDNLPGYFVPLSENDGKVIPTESNIEMVPPIKIDFMEFPDKGYSLEIKS